MSGKRLIIPGFFNKIPVFFLRFAPRSIVPAVVRKIQEARS
jgi:short-subunit dehydrogenase